MAEKMKADKERLLDEYSKMDRDIGASTMRSAINPVEEDHESDNDKESLHKENISNKSNHDEKSGYGSHSHKKSDSESYQDEKSNNDSESEKPKFALASDSERGK